jgi:kynureninase
VRPGLLEQLEPRITGWAAHEHPFAFETGAQHYAEGARRLLNGTPPVVALLAATAGYETVLEVGVENIRKHSVALTEALRADLGERGFTSPSPSGPRSAAARSPSACAPTNRAPRSSRRSPSATSSSTTAPAPVCA